MTESIEDRLEVLLKAGAEPAEAKLVGMEQQEQQQQDEPEHLATEIQSEEKISQTEY